VRPWTTPELFDRGADLATLHDLLIRVPTGTGGVAFVEGAAGIGKTSLGQAVADTAVADGFQVLGARGAVLERELPFGIVRQLFDPVLRRLDGPARTQALEGAAALAGPALGLATIDAHVDPTPEAVRSSLSSAFHGLYWLTANLAEDSPVLMWVDDAHWADGPSAQFLAYLSRRVADLDVVLVVGARPAEPGADEALGAIRDEPGSVTLSPSPLGQASVAALLRDALARDPEPAFVAECSRRTGGNPYLLHELVVDLQARGVAPTAAGLAEIEELGRHAVGRSIGARLERMPAGGRELAEALAVIETASDLRLVAAVANLDLEPAGDVADALVAVEILSPGAELAFRHPLVRAAVYAQVPASRRALLHGRAADALGAAGAGAGRVAAQLLRSQPRGDQEVVLTLRRAATEAIAQAAPATAAACLARAIAEPVAPDGRIELLRELGAAEVAAGRDVGVEHLQEAIAGLVAPRERAVAALELAAALSAHVRFGEARAVLLDGIDAARGVDRELWLLLEAQLAFVQRLDLHADHELPSRIDELASGLCGETPGERAVLAAAKSGARVGSAESADEAADLADWIVSTELGPSDGPDPFANADGPSPAITTATFAELPMLVWADRLDATAIYTERILTVARQHGVAFPMVFGLVMRATVARARGAVDEAEADARLAMEAGRDISMPPVFGSLVFALVERGALDEADEQLEHAGYAADLPAIMPMTSLLFERGRLRLAQNRVADAIMDFEMLGRWYGRWGVRRPASPWRSELALALRRAERSEEAVGLAREGLEMAHRWGGTPRSVAIEQRAVGLLSPDPEESLELLRSSVRMLEATPGRLELAYSLAALGSALRRGRQRQESRPLLERAMDIATRCGATVLAERAREELLATGARPRRQVLSGADSLTPSERRIADMAARGLSNKQIAQELFVSTRTVETHLMHAYQKLEISSRTDLTVGLARAKAQ